MRPLAERFWANRRSPERKTVKKRKAETYEWPRAQRHINMTGVSQVFPGTTISGDLAEMFGPGANTIAEQKRLRQMG